MCQDYYWSTCIQSLGCILSRTVESDPSTMRQLFTCPGTPAPPQVLHHGFQRMECGNERGLHAYGIGSHASYCFDTCSKLLI